MRTPVQFVRFRSILAGGAALLLMLAACSPAATPASTVAPATEFPTVAVATEAPTQALATEASTSAATEIATSAATAAATSAATSAATEAATEAATAAVTANATAAGTEAANAPLLIESDKLLGMDVKDSSSASLGTIVDVLVTTTGTVQAVVLNLSTSGSAAGTPEATSAATQAATAAATEAATSQSATQTVANGNTVAVPWTSIMADPTTQQLTYQGTASDLSSMPKFDEALVSTGYVVRAQGTTLPAQYDGLIRLGDTLKDIKLQTPSNQKLGAVQHVIIDLHSGMANYAVLDASTFLGATAEPVLVPFNKFQLDTTDTKTTTPVVRLNVTKDSLTSAPKFDATKLSFWPTPANNDWDSQIQLFWQSAAS